MYYSSIQYLLGIYSQTALKGKRHSKCPVVDYSHCRVMYSYKLGCQLFLMRYAFEIEKEIHRDSSKAAFPLH